MVVCLGGAGETWSRAGKFSALVFLEDGKIYGIALGKKIV